MSDSLSAEVAEHTQARWVRAVPAFVALSREFAVEVALALGTKSFSPDEVRLAALDAWPVLYAADSYLPGPLLRRGQMIIDSICRIIKNMQEMRRLYEGDTALSRCGK